MARHPRHAAPGSNRDVDGRARPARRARSYTQPEKWERLPRYERSSSTTPRAQRPQSVSSSSETGSPELSSSAVRALLREKNWGEVAGLVPERVLSYIQEHGLYQDG